MRAKQTSNALLPVLAWSAIAPGLLLSATSFAANQRRHRQLQHDLLAEHAHHRGGRYGHVPQRRRQPQRALRSGIDHGVSLRERLRCHGRQRQPEHCGVVGHRVLPDGRFHPLLLRATRRRRWRGHGGANHRQRVHREAEQLQCRQSLRHPVAQHEHGRERHLAFGAVDDADSRDHVGRGMASSRLGRLQRRSTRPTSCGATAVPART